MNPDLFSKIQAIKIAKKIKDPEKKVPLLRIAQRNWLENGGKLLAKMNKVVIEGKMVSSEIQ